MLVRRIARYVPIGIPVAGKRRDWAFRLIDALHPDLTGVATISTPYGTLQLDVDHEPERLLYYLFDNVLRYYMSSELGRYVGRIAEHGTTFLDIGANLGMYGLVAQHYGFRTVLIEPEPRHAAFLQRNSAIFGSVHSVALSDRTDELPLYYEADNYGATSLVPSPTYRRSEATVPVRTFTDLAHDGAFGDSSAIRLIKIDVEGLEAQVVRGMRGFLSRGARPLLWCEVRGDASDRNPGSYREVAGMLADFGYTMHEMRNGRDVIPRGEDLDRRSYFDLLFAPPAAG